MAAVCCEQTRNITINRIKNCRHVGVGHEGIYHLLGVCLRGSDAEPLIVATTNDGGVVSDRWGAPASPG